MQRDVTNAFFFAALPELRRLALDVYPSRDQHKSFLCAALPLCRQLAQLTLSVASLLSSVTECCFQQMAELRSLSLYSCRDIPYLAFLALSLIHI